MQALPTLGPSYFWCVAPAGEVQVPGPPTDVHAAEVSRTYVVLSWEPPVPRGKEPLMYFIEKVPSPALFLPPGGGALGPLRMS